MTFDVEKLTLNIREYPDADMNAMFGTVGDHNPYNEDGGYSYDIGTANMNDNGVCTSDGDELKG